MLKIDSTKEHIKISSELIEKLNSEILQISALMTQKYTGKNSLLIEKIDATTGKILSYKEVVNEIGDYVQNLYVVGEIFKKDYYRKWAYTQIFRSSQLCQTPSGLFVPNTRWPLRKTIFCPISPLSNPDAIVGLAIMYKLTEDPTILKIFCRNVQGLFKYCVNDEGFILYATIPALRFSIPFTTCMLTGNYVESLMDVYDVQPKQEFVKLAYQLVDPWICDPFFKKNGLFHKKVLKLPVNLLNSIFKMLNFKPTYEISIMKDNTHIMFGLLALYRVTKDSILLDAMSSWVNAALARLYSSVGAFYSYWDARTNKCKEISLEKNHSATELFIDLYDEFHEDRYLKIAENTAQFWIKKTFKTGLIPTIISSNSIIANLDPQIDYMVDLLKLYELTEKQEYYNSALKILNAILSFHRLPYGYAWQTNGLTGKIINSQTETKYLGLLLKALILARATLMGESIMTIPKLRLLSRDR